MSIAPSTTPLYKQLKETVRLFFLEEKKSRFGDAAMWFKMVLFFFIALTGYVLLLTVGANSFYIVVAGYLLYMLGSTLFVVNVGHDASHRALLKNKNSNTFLSYSWNMLGISKHLWEIKHHHSHHVYTNIPHQDVDIAESPLLRLSPAYPFRPHYRYQHLYAPFLYLLFGIFVVYVRDFTLFYSTKLDAHNRSNLPRSFWMRLWMTKFVFLLVSFLIPVWILPYAWWQLLIVYLICMATSGSLMLLILVVPHLNADAVVTGQQPVINNQNDWALLQIQCTVDSSADSRLLNWLSGGLNTHLVHHLFPNICHIHYLKLTKAIRNTLAQNGLAYKEKSFFASLTDHFKYLKQLGRGPSPASVM